MPNDNSTALATQDNRIAVAGDGQVVEGNPKGVASYLSFVWAKTQNDDLKANLAAQGATLPTFVLTRAGFPQGIKPLLYHVLHAETIATQMNESGQIVDALPTMPQDGFKDHWAEHTFGVVAVVQGDSLVPALIQLRSGARKAVTNAKTFTDDAGKAGWEKRGVMFKVAAETTDALSGRVIATGSVTPEKNEKSGRMQLVGRCSPRPTTKGEAERFNAAMNDAGFRADLEATFKALDWKLKGYLSKTMAEAVDE